MNYLSNCPICKSSDLREYLVLKDYFLSNEEFKIDSCTNCGFRFTNPRPKEEDIGKYYNSSEYISHSNNKRGLFNKVYQIVRSYSINKKINILKKYGSSTSLLDIGCGTGEFLKAISEKGYHAVGVEPNETARQFAISEYNLNIKEEVALNDIDPDSFEIITLWHVLEHVYNLEERVELISKIIRPDGALIIAVPNPDSYDAKRYKKYWAAYDVPRHLYHFTKKDLNSLLDRFSFNLVEVIPMKFDSFYVSLLSEKYENGSQRIICALINGFHSNIWAKFHQKNYSSLIYIFKPK